MEITVHIPGLNALAEAITRAAGALHPQLPPACMTSPTLVPFPTATPTPVQAAPGMPAPTVAPVPTQAAPPAAPVPTAAPAYKIEDIMRAACVLAENGRRPEVLALMQEFGVPALNQLPSEAFGSFAARLRQLGAQI